MNSKEAPQNTKAHPITPEHFGVPPQYAQEAMNYAACVSDKQTLRDHFAEKALPACYAAHCYENEKSGWWGPAWRDAIAKDAYLMADAMLRARSAA